MTDWVFHIHLIAAISWIGGSVFMFVLGVTLTDKKVQKAVYPHVGPIFGWFEVGALVILLMTGLVLGSNYSLFPLLFSGDTSSLTTALKWKAFLVLVLTIVTIIHFVIAYRTNIRERTRRENLISRGSSMLIFFLNLFVMHYGIMLRNILN